MSRLTGEGVTYKRYKGGSTVAVVTLEHTRSSDPKDWRGRVEFTLKHKPQLRLVKKKSEPRRGVRRLASLRPKGPRMAECAKLDSGPERQVKRKCCVQSRAP